MIVDLLLPTFFTTTNTTATNNTATNNTTANMQEPIPAFSEDVRAEFYEWIRRPEHMNRARMSYEKQRILTMFLRTPSLRPLNKVENDIRIQVHGYQLDEDPGSNTLWRLRDSGHHQDREVILEDLAFDTIIRAHCQHAHPGKNKTFDLIRERYYGITKDKVSKLNNNLYSDTLLIKSMYRYHGL